MGEKDQPWGLAGDAQSSGVRGSPEMMVTVEETEASALQDVEKEAD